MVSASRLVGLTILCTLCTLTAVAGLSEVSACQTTYLLAPRSEVNGSSRHSVGQHCQQQENKLNKQWQCSSRALILDYM